MRSKIVDIFSWLVIFASFIVLFSQYVCSEWTNFLKWVTFVGLSLDAIGAIMLALIEFPQIGMFLWTDLIHAKKELTENMNELEPNNSGFDHMVEITKDRRSITLPNQQESDVQIVGFEFYGDDDIFARVDGGMNQVSLGSQNLVSKWIKEEIEKLTRNKITPYAIALLATGFVLQLLAYPLRTF